MMMMVYVGYHQPFQHNELFHLTYMAVAEINLGISHVLITNSLSLLNALSCKYNYFPHKSWFVLLLLLFVFTNQNTTIYIMFIYYFFL